jgi:DNA-binding transcriptional MerR regulator
MFTDKDMQVFSLVSAFKKQGLTYADIHAALQSGQRGEVPALPADELEAIVSNDRDHRLARENEYLQQSLARAQEDLKAVAALREELQETQEKNMRLEIELEIIKAQQERLEQTVRELSRELGREYAKGFTDAWREKGDTPTQNE